MKILNVNSSLDFVTGGGGVERTFKMSSNLIRHGIECTILTTDHNFKDEYKNRLNGINLVVIPCLVKRYFWPKLSLKIINEVVEKHDIIHLMAHWGVLNALVFIVARRLKKPYVVCPVGTLPIFGKSKLFKLTYNSVIGKKIIKKADAHIAVTEDEVSQFIPYGVNPDKVFIIPNGVDENDLKEKNDSAFRKKFALSDQPFILFLGRLNFIKGPDLLLKAFCNIMSKVQHYELVFAGPDSGMLTELQNLVTQCGAADRVHFLGYIEGFDKSRAYHAADLVVIPSRQEAMSIVVIEAGITGTPVLITDNCGFDDITKVNGGLVVSSTVGGLENGLLSLLHNPQELKIKGDNLKKYTLANFSWNSIIVHYINLYQGLLNS